MAMDEAERLKWPTIYGRSVRVRLKKNVNRVCCNYYDYLLVCALLVSSIPTVQCNKPPRFLIDGQTEIVLRLKEGTETPVGKLKNLNYKNVPFSGTRN